MLWSPFEAIIYGPCPLSRVAHHSKPRNILVSQQGLNTLKMKTWTYLGIVWGGWGQQESPFAFDAPIGNLHRKTHSQRDSDHGSCPGCCDGTHQRKNKRQYLRDLEYRLMKFNQHSIFWISESCQTLFVQRCHRPLLWCGLLKCLSLV